jgi:hypothetical protein
LSRTEFYIISSEGSIGQRNVPLKRSHKFLDLSYDFPQESPHQYLEEQQPHNDQYSRDLIFRMDRHSNKKPTAEQLRFMRLQDLQG